MMASREKVRKKKGQSPAVKRKASNNQPLKLQITTKEEEEENNESVQGSQVSVRSASEENIQDNTTTNDSVQKRKESIPIPQSSSSDPHKADGKKGKKDLVEEKLDKKKDGKGKQDGKKGVKKQVTGSTVSLQSVSSKASREAWVERKEEDVKKQGHSTQVVEENEGQPKPRLKFPGMKDNKVAPTDTDTNEATNKLDFQVQQQKTEPGLKGVKVEIEEDCPEKHAYIPYLYARNCIAKITEDMKTMKQNHIIIVENIQQNYNAIEAETQEQFNMFVLCLREEYSSKRQAFRQVIDIHKVELEKKENYWNEMLTSLAERNNRLLKEKRMLLVHNKTEIERLEREKEDLSRQYSDVSNTAVVVPGGWQDERKILEDELANEKATNQTLRQQLAKKGADVAVVESTTPVKVEQATTDDKQTAAYGAAGALTTAGILSATKENNQQMESERKTMNEERDRMTEERTNFEEERASFVVERQKWLDKIAALETQLATSSLDGNEWKVKHDVMKGRLEEAGDIQNKYQTLQAQYNALALVVNNADPDTVKSSIEKTNAEKGMMEEEKKKLDEDIEKWEKDFVKANKRKPTEDDKSDSVREMYNTWEEVSYMVTTLETRETTLKQVEQGKVPDVPNVAHKPIDTRDPEVVTVQVKVPDPDVVAELEKSQAKVTILKSDLTDLQQKISDLNTQISEHNQHIDTQRARIVELEHIVAKLKAEGVAAGPIIMATDSGVSSEELEALKNENRELRRDMKKMIKQYQRLSEMKQSEGDSKSTNCEDMTATLGDLDSKIADLEAENETLKEERVLLREKVKTITETITITHFEDNKKVVEEKDKRIDDLLNELTKLREENTSMAKDMKKMVKSHSKTKAQLDQLQGAQKAVQLLEIVAMLIHEIHSQVPSAAEMVHDKLTEAVEKTNQSKSNLDVLQAAYQDWLDLYQKKHGKPAAKGDRDAEGERLHGDWEKAKAAYQEKHLYMSALLLMKTGDVSGAVGCDANISNKDEVEISNLEKALTTADNKVIDLEASVQTLTNDRDRHRSKVEDLEKMLEDMTKQLQLNQALMADSQSTAELTEQLSNLQKKADGFESELMQERMSHMNTRDELELLRRQMDVLKQEVDTERQGVEGQLEAVRMGLQAQIELKNQELAILQAKKEELEAEKLANLPPDAAAQVKALQDKLNALEKDESGSKSSAAALTAQLQELTTKLETTGKNLETTRASNRELEAKLKSGRSEKERDAKKLSRHMEEKQHKASNEDKQRIALLVKRVKELEAHAGKSQAVVAGAAAGVGASDKASQAEVLKLKREIKDLEAEIKRLQKEVRLGGGGGMSVKEEMSEKHKTAKHEKILKELEKKLAYEKEKGEKVLEGLKAADTDNKTLQKEVDEKNHEVAKLKAEIKSVSVAAKEGVEAAAKVKQLETDNKKLNEENVVLTKNFESERVLRKKYYNQVEDMKGKIRVYCRARPMSKSELDRGNKAVCTSVDEFSIAVNSTRGLKEFQYDQVFMEDSTQEKIFEDTNNLIQSAMDGYNVCIFAYGQTGSGKTFTMIGDRDQNFPGIAPRAFDRIFDLADEVKSKFTTKIEVYMMELYNDKLIDLFAKPGNNEDYSQDKLDIKKDKKGMVYVQGSVIKAARNAKELFALFEEGSANRHVASTKMNAESSRSHLVVGIIIESTNRNTGNVTKGKLSLVDLAGSERVAKTQAGADQLKEAMSINKSLSALGDVISALSSDQQFIPYRNNKLTMLMQDSLGGNAKTLMFVNISPADYNMDETVISLTYASRVKLITNDASKNADNKEIARLRGIIEKMKKGETVDVDE